ncbi:hypothetical protein GJV85_12325 [Sulfurimonas aquatica]|uniref:TolC family protein n=1 Tax=Sulfurimonas aquatica TaxID=2672570 RepID=A0A975GDN2_9BACT|nr:TolC family protein [Sulfurimonas aquatica]QSZ42860.1 hypothetical protein GJV85_12325 [Sulfurimonas aquatica]
MKFFLFFLLCFTLNAKTISLDDAINLALKNNPSLESINKKIEINRQNIKLSTKFSNPQLQLTKNTLDSSQAMSQTTLTLSQKLPLTSKRHLRERVSMAEQELIYEEMRDAKVALVKEVKLEAYTLWELQELKQIIKEYINLTEQNIELYESYTSISDNQHMGIMKAKLSLSDLKIGINIINTKIKSSYARLSYLCSSDISDLEVKLLMGDKPEFPRLQDSLKNNTKIAIKAKERLKQNAKIEVASIENYPDINLMAGYSHRENFDDFLNIGIGLSLPIYSREDLKEEKERQESLRISSLSEDVTNTINTELNIYYLQMLSSYDIYHIIQDDSLPQVEHMFELTHTSISTGSDLFKYVDILFSKLKLEQKSINAISNYNRAKAEISALGGALQ